MKLFAKLLTKRFCIKNLCYNTKNFYCDKFSVVAKAHNKEMCLTIYDWLIKKIKGEKTNS